MKLRYNFEIKKIKNFGSFEDLQQSSKKAFQDIESIFQTLRYWYFDLDGDIISISNDSDFDQFLEEMKDTQKRVAIAASMDEAKNQLSQDQFGVNLGAAVLDQSMQSIRSSHYAGHGQLGGIGQLAHNQLEQILLAQSRAQLINQAQVGHNLGQNQQRNIVDFSNADQNQRSFFQQNNVFDESSDSFSLLNQRAPNTERILNNNNFFDQQLKNTMDAACNTEFLDEAMDKVEDLPNCYKCGGSKLNSRGAKCKKCDGTGKLSNPFFVELRKMLAEEVRKARMDDQRVSEKVEPKLVHEDVRCEQCKCCPIIGIRYKCTIRDCYNYCEQCESNCQPLPYPVIKIRNPIPWLKEESGFEENKIEEPEQIPIRSKKTSVALPMDRDEIKFLQASVIRSAHGKHCQPSQLQNFEWKFKNTGELAWPTGVEFRMISGSPEIKLQTWQTSTQINPGTIVQLNLSLVAPEKPGKYNSTFKFADTQTNIEFGEEVDVDIEVRAALQIDPVLLKSQQMMNIIDKKDEGLNTSIELVGQGGLEIVSPQSTDEVQVLQPDEMNLKNSVMPDAESNHGSSNSLIMDPYIEDIDPKDRIQVGEKPEDPNLLIQRPAEEEKGSSLAEFYEVPDKDIKDATLEEVKDDAAALHMSDANDNLMVNYSIKLNEGQLDGAIKANMIELMNMGFYDFDKNLKLLQDNDNKMDEVLDKIMV